MKILYLTEQGCTVKKTSRRLVIVKDGKILNEVSIIGLDSVIVFGNIQLTTQVIASLLEAGIMVSFLSSGGKFRGILLPGNHKNVFLRISQYERYLDDEFQRTLASQIVLAKIGNGENLIMRHSKNHPEIDFSQELTSIRRIKEKVKVKPPIPVLLGLEGSATSAYFRAFRKMLHSKLEFTCRTKRPPKDPVNTLLSFGYSILINEILSMLFAVGFDPYIGYLHGIDYGRPALALDIVEEYRHPIIDRLVLNLINRKVITENDFSEDEEKGIILCKEGIKKYIENYELMFREKCSLPKSGDSVTFRDLIRQQVYKLSRTIMTRQEYTPFMFS